jgi:hypothetical protein
LLDRLLEFNGIRPDSAVEVLHDLAVGAHEVLLKFQLGASERRPSSRKTGFAALPVTADGLSMSKVTP